MLNLDSYTNINHTATLGNGTEVAIYSKQTKRGVRYFYWSNRNGRMMPISKVDAGIM